MKQTAVECIEFTPKFINSLENYFIRVTSNRPPPKPPPQKVSIVSQVRPISHPEFELDFDSVFGFFELPPLCRDLTRSLAAAIPPETIALAVRSPW